MTGLEAFLTGEIYRFLLILIRIGTAMMTLPGFGEAALPGRVRIALAVIVSLCLMGTVPGLPAQAPAGTSGMFQAILGEVLVGAFLGTTTRIIYSSLTLAGQFIGQSMSLANPFSSGGAGFEGGTIVSAYLTMGGLAMIFALGLDHLMIKALLASYDIMPAAQMPPIGDLAMLTTKSVSKAFEIGVKFSIPFIVLAFIFNLGLALVNRMMPTMPVFFVAMPISITVGLIILAAAMGAVMFGFAEEIQAWLALMIS